MLAAALIVAATAGRVQAGGADDRSEPDATAVFDELTKRFEPPVLRTAQAEGDASSTLKIEPGDDSVRYDTKNNLPGTPMDGRSLEELIVGKPVFPPIEGLDPSIWQNKNCGTCHQWTKERLCTQAKTYVGADKMVHRIKHPYGLEFKQLLERWGEAGCP